MEPEPAPETVTAELPFRPLQRRYSSNNVPTERPTGVYRPAIVAASILLAAFLAHGWCVRSTFHADDWHQIVANDWVDHGDWFRAGLRMGPYFTYWLTYLGFGLSSPAFHAGNLLLHGVVALIVAGFARSFLHEGAGLPLGQARRIGWWAGLLFAVHPLGSEVPNYVRARDIELTTLFTLLAGWAALRWRRQRKPRFGWPVLTLLAVTAATGCKEIGFFVATATAGLVWTGTRRAPDARLGGVALPLDNVVTRAKTKLVVSPKDASLVTGNWPVLLSLFIVFACVGLWAWPSWAVAVASVRHPRLGWHALTQARVFWMYLARFVAPVGLCSDHLIPWTYGWNDPVAWAAAAGELGVLAATGFLLTRRADAPRAVGVLLGVVLFSFLHRLANPNAVPMAENRAYLALGPLCILLAWALGKAEGRGQQVEGGGQRGEGGDAEIQRAPVRWAVVLVLVASGAALSARRAQAWRDTASLTADTVAQYPLQAQALLLLQAENARAGYWTETLRNQGEIRTALDGQRAFNTRRTDRKYDPDRMFFVHLSSEGNAALALANLGRKQEALDQMEWLSRALHPGAGEMFYKGEFLLRLGLVNAALNRNPEALDELREAVRINGGSEGVRALRRVEAKKG